MSEVDISKLKPGDEVLVRMRVWSTIGDAPVVVCRVGAEDAYAVSAQYIHSVLPRPIQVGDRVSVGADPTGVVLAIHKGRAWVDSGLYWDTYDLADLERIDD